MAEPTERELGFAEGVLSQRLDQYDDHFRDINGSQAKTAEELALLRRAVDSLAAAQREANSLAVAVAEALEKKEAKQTGTLISNRQVIVWTATLFAAVLAIVGAIKAWFFG